VTIKFDIVPFSDKIGLMDLGSYVTFNASGCTVTGISIVSKQLVVSIDYSQSIENATSQMFINFDPNYVLSPNFTMQFQMI
jgi:hypothetical protein